jgi:hypothetical protein
MELPDSPQYPKLNKEDCLAPIMSEPESMTQNEFSAIKKTGTKYNQTMHRNR